MASRLVLVVVLRRIDEIVDLVELELSRLRYQRLRILGLVHFLEQLERLVLARSLRGERGRGDDRPGSGHVSFAEQRQGRADSNRGILRDEKHRLVDSG